MTRSWAKKGLGLVSMEDYVNGKAESEVDRIFASGPAPRNPNIKQTEPEIPKPRKKKPINDSIWINNNSAELSVLSSCGGFEPEQSIL